jgi:predicted O-methyltransferase YrrM
MIDGILEFPILPYYFAVRRARRIDGWLQNGEARFLFSAARLITPPNVIVEIGAWHGKSTVLLCRGSLAGHRAAVLSFDLFEIGGADADRYRRHAGKERHAYLDIWRRNVARAGGLGLARPIVGCSWENADQVPAPIGLLFVDGDHTTAGVSRDWEAFSPRLADKAIVMFHDYYDERTGVRQAVDGLSAGWKAGRVASSAILWRGF